MFATLEGPDGSGKTSQMGPLADHLRAAVLLPEEYRGVYKEHPRVKELEAGGAGKV